MRRYWQEQLDAGDFAGSVVMNPEMGFGGGGRFSDDCITDGPFRNYRNQIGIGYTREDQCIRRRFNETASSFADQLYVDDCLNTNNFLAAWSCIEGWPHYAGHAGVGRQVSRLTSSSSSFPAGQRVGNKDG